MKRIRCSTLPAALALLTGSPAPASDFDSERFALRLSSSLFRLSTYPDVAAKTGAAAASVDNTSFNPASLQWGRLSPLNPQSAAFEEAARVGLSAQALDIGFQNGTQLAVNAQSLVLFKTPIGPIRFSLVQLRSNEERARGGELLENIFEYDLDAYRFEWAHRFGSRLNPGRLGIGASVSFNQSEVNVFLPATTLLQPVITPRGQLGVARLSTDRAILTDANRDTFNARFGWQVSLIRETTKMIEQGVTYDVPNNDRLLWGTVVDYSHYITKRTSHVPGFSVETESGLVPKTAKRPFREGVEAMFPEAGTSRHTSHSVVTRTGLALKWLDEDYTEKAVGDGKTSADSKRVRRGAAWLHLDYQWSWFVDEAAEFQDHRLHAGVDIPLFFPPLSFTAGIVADDRKHVSWAAGLKFQAVTADLPFGKKTGVAGVVASVAYQHDPLPELGGEFGHSQLWAFALGLAF